MKEYVDGLVLGPAQTCTEVHTRKALEESSKEGHRIVKRPI